MRKKPSRSSFSNQSIGNSAGSEKAMSDYQSTPTVSLTNTFGAGKSACNRFFMQYATSFPVAQEKK